MSEGRLASAAVLYTIIVLNGVTTRSDCAGNTGAEFPPMTITVKVLVALNGGTPLSVTIVVMIFVLGGWVAVGVQVITPLASMVGAFTGAFGGWYPGLSGGPLPVGV